jgi:peptide/nickel transport system substrate-binding protein
MRSILFLILIAALALSACAPAPAAPAVPTEAAAPADPAQEAPATTPADHAPTATMLPEEPTAAPVSAEPQTVTRAITTEPGGLDPHGAAGSGQNIILPYLYDTLVYRGADNQFYPYLAESWEIAPDGLQTTFTLREGITFHDGTPLDADAVKFTFDRLKEQGQRSVLASMATEIESIEAVDARTVRFHFLAPSSTFLSSLATAYGGIISPAAVETYGEDYAQHPTGSGAFMLERWEPGVAITLARNPNYAWAPPLVKNQGAPHVDTLVFKVIPDVAQQILAFQNGEVDMLFVNQPSHLGRLRQDPNTVLVDTTLNSVVYLGFNARKAPFDDARVRQALSHAVNKEELLVIGAGGVGEIAFAPLSATLPGFDPSLKQYERGFDLEQSAALLTEAGFTQGADGMWAKNGQPLSLTLLTSTRPPNQALATVLQSQFKNAGVTVEIQSLDATAASDAAGEGLYDMLLWRYDWNDADVLRVYLSSERIGRTNRTFYSNPVLDDLLERAVRELDEAERNTLYLQAQQIILEDAAWHPLYTPKDYMAIRAEVDGVVMGAMGRVLMNDAVRKD